MTIISVDLIFSSLKQILLVTLTQFFWLFSVLFVFGFLLFLFARFTRITFAKIGGRTFDVILTGWIGTPIHEVGHAIFCLVFKHKIQEIKFYSPNSNDGTLGYVKHSFDSKSIYQSIGNFFIGIGPIILGSILIYLLMFLLSSQSNYLYRELLANNIALIEELYRNHTFHFIAIKDSLWLVLQQLFSKENLGNYLFWVFLYLSISISTHMELSPFDIKGAWKGLLTIVILMLMINGLIYCLEATKLVENSSSILRYFMIETYEKSINQFLSVTSTILFYATIVSGINFLLTYLLLNIYNLLKGKGLINPIW